MRPSEYDSEYGMFASFSDDAPKGKFQFSASDDILALGFEARCGSEILRGYVPPEDSAAVAALREAGGSLVGKTAIDEFTICSFGMTAECGMPRNPYGPARCCGGSSAGAAAAVAAIPGHVALASTSGAGINVPASFCGVYGLTPTWGRVSRHGLIDYAGSCDRIGLMSADPSDFGELLPKISFRDPRDPSSMAQPDLDLGLGVPESVAVLKDWEWMVSKEVRSVFEDALARLDGMGVHTDVVELPSLRYAMAAHRTIAAAEGSTSLARYCGLRYGRQDGDLSSGFDDYFTDVRTEHFGIAAKFASIFGTYVRMMDVRGSYYMNALAVRGALIAEFKRIFEDHDAIVMPTVPIIAPEFNEIKGLGLPESEYVGTLSVPQGLAGMPHVTMPCGYASGMPVGMQLVADHWNEGALIAAAEAWSKSFKAAKPGAVR